MTLTVLAPPAPAAVVTDVFVAATAWNAAYRNLLQSAGDGEAAFAYRIKANEQTRTMPWANLNQVGVRFSRHVNVAAGDLVLNGVNVAAYGLALSGAFQYDPPTFTATWTLARTIPNDKVTIKLDGDDGAGGAGVTDADGNLRDGEWTNPLHPALSAHPSPAAMAPPAATSSSTSASCPAT